MNNKKRFNNKTSSKAVTKKKQKIWIIIVTKKKIKINLAMKTREIMTKKITKLVKQKRKDSTNMTTFLIVYQTQRQNKESDSM